MDRIRLADDDLVYFLHIPRTGGTTFYEVLAARFAPDRCRKGGDRRRFASDMATMPADELARYRLISAHHDVTAVGLFDRSPYIVTMVRDPVIRLKSYYEILKRMPEHPLHDLAIGASFEEFLDDPRGGPPEADRQTRQIAGLIDGDADPSMSDADVLSTAYANLTDFAFFGIHEEYPASVRLLEHTFGWSPMPAVPRLNPSGPVDQAAGVSPAALDRCRRLNRLDLALYAAARSVFEERCAAALATRAGQVANENAASLS